MNEQFSRLGVKIPEILLPNARVDLFKWSVVACDQYTSEPDYWEQVARIVGEAPSTLNLILPEIYLDSGDQNQRIANIQQKMRRYLEAGIIVSRGPGFVYVDRRTSRVCSRKGLIMAIDLECYDYRRGAQTLIRATEGTVLERIPPRVKVREGALLELPHIMLLIDDPDCQVIEPLAGQLEQFDKMYETDLMMNGGHVKGFLIKDSRSLNQIYQGLSNLVDSDRLNQKYGMEGKPPLLFAVGDGNHSLAAAKAVWERIKLNPQIDPANHPARYALVEVVNVHDPGLQFEPIHRVLFKVSAGEVLAAIKTYYGEQNFSVERLTGREAMKSRIKTLQCQAGRHPMGFVDQEGYGLIVVSNPEHDLAVGTLQTFLDEWLAKNPAAEIDYIHGEEVVAKLGAGKGNIGFFLPALDKRALFKTVLRDGVLPRKSFSMGEAEEKRFYLECRRIG